MKQILKNKCWICLERDADSEEHKFKSSTIRSLYGKKFKEDILFIEDNEEFQIKNYKEQKLKFSKLICTKCNNEVTQGCDEAYDNFIKKTIPNFDKYMHQGCLDYKTLFPDWKEGKRNLYRYVAKLAGCRIAKYYPEILPYTFAKFVYGEFPNRCFKLHFVQKEAIVGIKDYLSKSNTKPFINLFNGPTFHFKKKNINFFHGWISIDWLSIHWLCTDTEDISINDIMNSPVDMIETQSISFKDRDESTNILDWIEYYGLSTFNERKNFIKSRFLDM